MEFPPHSAVPDQWLARFQTRALAHPSRTAILCGNAALTYGELARRSDEIAGNLAAKGLGPGEFVGIGLPRSLDLTAALLGVVKSGAAYIPLDPAYPEARIAAMTSSAKLSHVITTGALAAKFPHVEIVDCHALPAAAAPRFPYLGTEPMYAIFTSGSTGEPKAASVFRRSFENLLQWYANELQLGPDDTTLVISSPSFDLTQKNLFAPLVTGGKLVLDDCQTYDIPRISALIRDRGVTLVNCTPSAFYPLADAAAANDYAALFSLRFVVLGGEPISIPRLRTWLEHPNCRAEIVNSYGPTECTDICLFHRLHRGNIDDFPYVPLGREIPNVQVSIRDESMAPLPASEIGELCISGAGVGGGYLNDAARTAAAFQNNFYKSGDLAVRHPSGIFEFRGRADHQVKVNGFRIELGEIEIALGAHPDVREAIVTAASGRLTAHIRGDAATTDLRGFLATRLPGYMIPGEFQLIESFPLTPNGKVDRRALSQPAAISAPAGNATSLEGKILALWSEILGLPLSDPTANFFDLGGDSINLAVVHVRLIDMIGREFPITELFALPSARAIAGFLSPAHAANATPDRARPARAGFSNFRRPTPR